MTDSAFCFWHDPETQQAAAEARRLGGQRRRRESTVAGAYEFEGFGSVEEIRRFIEIAAFEVLALDNSVARVRAMTSLAQAAAQLLEKGELEERVRQLEAAVHRAPSGASAVAAPDSEVRYEFEEAEG
ncbi:MAG: hypothetical protein O2895_00395 [Chloroflexi bacterium]|nr:hypothetical protein [Chloroflexota bacterium]